MRLFLAMIPALVLMMVFEGCASVNYLSNGVTEESTKDGMSTCDRRFNMPDGIVEERMTLAEGSGQENEAGFDWWRMLALAGLSVLWVAAEVGKACASAGRCF